MATSPTCARCGESVAAGARFCMKCGSDVSGEQGGASTSLMEPAVDENAVALELLKKATIGDYEILRELGRGGMAAVYLAHDIALDRKVAIKVMSPALLLMGEGMVDRFKREARTAANLSHPNIIPIYAVKSSGKSLYFVMKFIPGRSLESIIKELGPMPVPLVRALLQQVGSALGYAHRNGIIHRDVKPANIMIDEEGWAFVTDFGIAKAAENRGLTMTGVAVGTPSYMSPEQCAAKDITGKSDQYSLGVVAYEMLTGKQPFEGDSAMAIMFAHFHEAPKPLSEQRPDCPPDLAAAVMRMLEKGPEKRWGSMEESLVALGAQPLAHEDPTRLELVKVVRSKSNREILDNITPPPTSPVPPAKTRQVPEAATTPIPAPPQVLSVTVAPGTAQLNPGQTIQLTATAQMSNGTAGGRTVSWTSDAPTIAMVSPAGLVTGVAVGSATIMAKIDGVSGTTAVVVTPPPVAKITVTPTERRIIAGDSSTFSATVLSADEKVLADRPLTWSSSMPTVATVSPRGIVSGLTPGSAEITVKCEGIEAKAAVIVTPVPVASVTVSQPDPVLQGKELTLIAILKDARGGALTGRDVRWSSAGPDIASVTSAGLVKALKPGTTRITAESEGKSWTVTLTVQPLPQAGKGEPQGSPDEVKTAEIPQQRKPSEAPRGEHRRGDPEGSPLRSEANRGRYGTGDPQGAPVPVPEVAVPVAAVGPKKTLPEITPPPPLAPEPVRSVERPVEQKSGTGKLIGAVVAIAVLAGVGYTLFRPQPEILPAPAVDTSFTLPVAAVSVEAVEIQGEAGPVAIGHTRQLAALLKDSKGAEVSGRDVTWRSSDPAVASVSSNGAVTGSRAGTVTITATSEGKSDEFGLTVEAAADDTPVAVAALAIDGGNKTLEVGATADLTVRVRDARGQPLADRTVVWSSDDPRIAQVSSTGEVRAISAGQTTISASSEGKSAETRMTVKAPPAPPPVAVPTPEPTPVAPAPVAVARIELIPSFLSMQPGQSAQILTVLTGQDRSNLSGRAVTWSSSDERVARVDNNGNVTGVAKGTSTITATSEGKRASIKATVNEPPSVAATPPVTTPAPAPVTQPPAATPAATTTGATLLPRRGAEAGGFGCGLATASVVCWGGTYSSLTAIEGTSGGGSVVVGRSHACALQNGTAVCWGDNRQGQLGGTSGNSSAEAVPVSGGQSFSMISAGANHTCGVAGGKAWCWGRGKEGQLGDASASERKKPVQVKGGVNFTSVYAGGNHTCALTAAGKAYCWGDGFSGQLGFGGQDQQSEPIDVSGNLVFSALAAGGKHTCGITSSGKAYCWGANESGQLGDGSKSDRAQPQAVAGGASFSAITAGNSHTCGLSGGEIYCWGENKMGQVGDGSKSDRNKPTSVSSQFSFSSVSAGDSFTCAVTRSGETACWGRNDRGQLGDGSTENRVLPTAIR